MKVTHNIQSLNAIRLVNINIESYAESTGKISSGYKINCAADNPAGLGISEIMRRQIRGLMQATNNTKDGVAFVQSADGAMNEIHSMLQRMNELTDKALNGTWSDSDRMAMNVEFDQLRSEMDRINNTTEFGTGIPVFEQHEPSYYQISGSKKWDDNQIHTVSESNNELIIYLPDGYEPKDYTITVPAGVYTTQELIDEIDTALSSMVPSNPGFVLELTSDGYCNLRFEKADGSPTEIASVDGSLSYLLFDSFNGNSSSNLMGTTSIIDGTTLTIERGENDKLEFYAESANGSKHISITIPPGKYSRSDIIKKINELLSKQPDASGIVAKEYEDSYIQLTGGNSVSIFGLKGNMFKMDSANLSSVFYDNVQYGFSGGTAASVRGKAYYNESITDKIYISSANQNNVLRFKANGMLDYTITFKDGKYTMAEIRDEINKQLDSQLDKYLKEYETELKASISDEDKVKEKLEEMKAKLKVQAGTGNSYVSVPSSSNGTTSHSLQYLTLTSALKGSHSSLEFDTTQKEYVNTYYTLFRDTNYFPYNNAGNPAQLTGCAYLNSSFTLPANAPLSFTINGNQTCTISGINGTYGNGGELVSKLNKKLEGTAWNGKLEFQYNDDGTISINALTDTIKKIAFGDSQKNAAYKQLFERTETETNNATTSSTSGTVKRIEGTTKNEVTADAKAYLTIPSSSNDIEITSETNKISISIAGSPNATITLTPGTYDSSKLTAHIASQINSQLKLPGNSYFTETSVSYDGNRITLTAKPNSLNDPGSYSIKFAGGTAWEAIYGTSIKTYTPTATDASANNMGNRKAISFPLTLNGSNNELTLTIGDDSATVKIKETTYNDRQSLAKEIQAAFNGTKLKGKFTVADTNGKLEFTSSAGSIAASESFYDNVLITQETLTESVTKGAYTDSDFQDAYIIGRKDLSTESIDIVKGSNDVLTFDFTYTAYNGIGSYIKEMNIKIPEGTYTGDEICGVLQDEIQNSFDKEGLTDFKINVGIGMHVTEVFGAIDKDALQIEVTRNGDAEPAAGQYVLDGVRGSAAGYLFYKTTINPNATFITGTKNLFNGVTFKPGQNVLTLSVDSVPYKYTFPENTNYTAKEFVDLLNDMFENGDDNGNSAPLKASIENGSLKITHKSLGSHSITDIGGSARSTLFLEEEGRDSLDPLLIQVGAEANQTTEIPRISVSSTALNVNSITISKQKYAEKANVRIKEAINLLSSKRSIYGAIQNRLEHTINNNDIVVDRMQASESRIRDTDLSSEMVRYSNLSILLQAGQKMLAQSNENIKKLLNLLQ